MKKIHITESQMRRIVSEMTLSGDQELLRTKDPKLAAQNTIKTAKETGANINDTGTEVAFSTDALKKGCGVNEGKNSNYIKYTKKQVNEARSNRIMKEGCISTTKKAILNEK